MRIVFVNSCRYLGGAEWWQLRAAAALRARGHEPWLLAREGPLRSRAVAAGFAGPALTLSFDLDLYAAFRAFRFFRDLRPDLVLLNDQRECRLVAPAAAAAGIRARVQRKGWPFLKGSWRDKLVYGRAVTHLIAVSEEVAAIFRARSGLAPERIQVLPNGVEVERFAPRDQMEARRNLGLPPAAPIVGSAGRLVSQKNFDLLLAAAARLPETTVVALAGAGEERERLQARAAELGLGSRLLLLGQVEDMPGFLAALDVFAFPSRQEGRSNALLEAMASGLPVIAGDIPGNREMIAAGRTGLLFPPGDAAALAAAIGRLLGNREQARALGEAARSFAVEHFSAERMWDELESRLQAIVDETRGSDDGPDRFS